MQGDSYCKQSACSFDEYHLYEYKRVFVCVLERVSINFLKPPANLFQAIWSNMKQYVTIWTNQCKAIWSNKEENEAYPSFS